MNDFERRNRPLFPISIVMELTELTARQIRYYEEHELIKPARTKGRHRLFSFADIDNLLEIKNLLDKGVNLAGIKEIFTRNELEYQKNNLHKEEGYDKAKLIPYSELRKMLKRDIINQRPGQRNSLIQGELSRFFR